MKLPEAMLATVKERNSIADVLAERGVVLKGEGKGSVSNDLFAPLPLAVLRRRDIPSTAKIIYARLKLFAGKKNTAFCSVSTMGRECGLSPRRVIHHIAALELSGLVTTERKQGCGNRYHLAPLRTSDGNSTSDANGTSDGSDTGLVTDAAPPPVPNASLPPVSNASPHRKEELKRGIEKKSEKKTTASRTVMLELSNIFSSEFKTRNKTEYLPSKADYVQLATFLRTHRSITPDQFRNHIRQVWALSHPKMSWYSLRGICSDWSITVAALNKSQENSQSKNNHGIKPETEDKYAGIGETR